MNKATATKGAAWMMLFSLVSKVLFPIVGIFITGRVGVDAVGVFGIVIALYTVTELFRDGGLAITFISDTNNEHGTDGLYQGLAISLGVVFASFTIIAAPFVATFYETPEMAGALRWTAISMVIGSLASIPGSRFVREAKFREAGLIDVFSAGVGYAVALALALLGYGLLALLIQMVLRGCVYLILTLRYAGWIRPEWEFKRFGRLLRVTMANLGANIAYTVYTMADYAVIGKALGQSANGAYWVAFNIASKPFDLITGPISRTMFIAFSREKGNVERQAHLLCRTLTAVGLFAIPAYVLIGVHANTIIGLLYPKGFASAGPTLGLLAIYLGFRSIGSPAGSALVASGKASLQALSWLPGYLIAVTGIAYFWTRGTLLSFVAVLTIGAVSVYATNLIVAWRTLRPTTEDWKYMLAGVVTCVPALVAIISPRFAPIPPWSQLVLALVLGGLVHLAVLAQRRLGRWTLGFQMRGLKEIYKTL